jgi:hypothetical protein
MLSLHVISHVQFISTTGSLFDHLRSTAALLHTKPTSTGTSVTAATLKAVIKEIYNTSNTFSILFYSHSNLTITQTNNHTDVIHISI